MSDTMPMHTPGPWQVSNDPAADRPCDQVVRDAEGWSIAYLPGADSAADARLIAAAPDLLVAAQWAIAQLADPIHGEGSSYGRDYEYLRAAIARARGEE